MTNIETEERKISRVVGDIFLAMRPEQWSKNLIVLAAFFFAYFDKTRTNPLEWSEFAFVVIPACLLFCLISSGIYILNDIMDIDADRQHPTKRNRPIAAGRIPVNMAWLMSLNYLIGGLIGAFAISTAFALCVCVYVALQLAYIMFIKRIALADIMVIAVGFVIRAIAGAMVLAGIMISPWLLVCTFLLALFLASCKRRQEKVLIAMDNSGTRASLEQYDVKLLDQIITITAASTVVSYAIYTLSEQTIVKFDTHNLALTIPFVVFGIFRYLDLVYRQKEGERPERVLYTDLTMLFNIILYCATAAIVLKYS